MMNPYMQLQRPFGMANPAAPLMGAPMPVTHPQMGLQPVPVAPQPSPMRSQIANYMGAQPSTMPNRRMPMLRSYRR